MNLTARGVRLCSSTVSNALRFDAKVFRRLNLQKISFEVVGHNADMRKEFPFKMAGDPGCIEMILWCC